MNIEEFTRQARAVGPEVKPLSLPEAPGLWRALEMPVPTPGQERLHESLQTRQCLVVVHLDS